MVGRISIASSPCVVDQFHRNDPFSKHNSNCRQKRETSSLNSTLRKTFPRDIHLNLETLKDLFNLQILNTTNPQFKDLKDDKFLLRQNNVYPSQSSSETLTSKISIHLRHTPQIVAPHFKLVVRDQNSNIISTNQTTAFPSCLYTGDVDGVPTAKVSLSVCGGIDKLVRCSIYLLFNSYL